MDPIIFQRAAKSADMNEVIAPATGGPFALVFLRAHFSDNASAATVKTADLAVYMHGSPHNVDLGGPWNAKLYVISGVGLGADANFRVPANEMAHWVIDDGFALRVTWTNPDPGKILWGLEAGLTRWINFDKV